MQTKFECLWVVCMRRRPLWTKNDANKRYFGTFYRMTAKSRTAVFQLVKMLRRRRMACVMYMDPAFLQRLS